MADPLRNRAPAWLRRLLGSATAPPQPAVSTDYIALATDDAGAEAERLRDAWKAQEMPARQRELVDGLLEAWRNGASVAVFDCFVRALQELPELSSCATICEIGCSSGYYSEVIAVAGLPLAYTGCDYSDDFITLARACHPQRSFDVEDATRLSYPDDAFDIAVSGCCLLHIPDYPTAILETARIARRYTIFHRTPVFPDGATRFYRKKAYGVETIEIHFGEQEFLDLCRSNGLVLLSAYNVDGDAPAVDREHSVMRTYVFEKRASS